MSGGSSGLSRFSRTIVACVLVSVLIVITGCTRRQSSRQEATKPAVMEHPFRSRASAPSTPPPPPVLSAPGGREKPEPQVLEDTGKILWAKGYEGILIAGFDDGLYEPYLHAVIERVQLGLRARGLYIGPVNGVLDKPTMESLYAFQTANKILQRCGIPTPFTRKMLEQGSHTDPAS
jgi:hypothetical protein